MERIKPGLSVSSVSKIRCTSAWSRDESPIVRRQQSETESTDQGGHVLITLAGVAIVFTLCQTAVQSVDTWPCGHVTQRDRCKLLINMGLSTF